MIGSIFCILVWVCYLPSPFFFTRALAGHFIFWIVAYHLFTLLWHLCTCLSLPLFFSFSLQVPVALTDSLQPVGNGTPVNLAPTHIQNAAYPAHQPASISETGKKAKLKVAGISERTGNKKKASKGRAWILQITSVPGLCLVDAQQVAEAKERVLAKLFVLNMKRIWIF